MTKHIVVQRRLHRFAYLIILCYQLWFTHAIPLLYFSSMSPALELNTGNSALAETTSEAYYVDMSLKITSLRQQPHLPGANQLMHVLPFLIP